MISEFLILGGSAVVAKDALTIEYLKSKMIDLSDEEKQDFLNNENRRFLHFTSEKSAKQIMKSGFLIPTKGKIKNHFTKKIDENGKKKDSEMVYMFDSKYFNMDEYIKNLPMKRSPYAGIYEYYAVSMSPNKYSINSFKRRVQDNAITYDGRLDINGTDTKLSKFVIDLDKENNYTFKEIGLDEEYIPSEELLNKLAQDKKKAMFHMFKSYALDVKRSKEIMKTTFRANNEAHKEQIRRKREFVKANKQFKEEEKDKNYIFEQDGKTIVVKNIGYEEVDGRKLQKVAIIGNGFDDKEKRLEDVQKLFFMDEFNIENMEPEVASKYFFNNYENMIQTEKTEKYIGLPLQNLETGEVINEYDDGFKNYFDRKQASKEYSEEYIKNNKRGFFSKVKSFFSKIASRFKTDETKMLPEAKYEDKEKLARLGYSSVEEMNRFDDTITILDELQNETYSLEEINENIETREQEESLLMDEHLLEGKEEIDDISI